MKLFGTALLTLTFTPIFLTAGEMREFRNPAGKVIKAEVLSKSDNQVTLKLDNGRELTSKIDIFSKEDQDYLNAWQPAITPGEFPVEADFQANREGKKETIKAANGQLEITAAPMQYTVSLTNTGKTELSGLKMQYKVFKTKGTYSSYYKTEGMELEGDFYTLTGESELDPIGAYGEVEATTPSIPISEFELVLKGSGSVGPEVVEEELAGIWIRLTDSSGKQVFEAKSDDRKLEKAKWGEE